MKRLVSILLWSAISAAFIGPGTVASTAAAGAGFEYALLWALVFSTLACLVLQEASARLTIVTGKPLAGLLGEAFAIPLLAAGVVGAVVLGCMAYQAGNILGAVAGVSLGFSLPQGWVTLSTGLLAGFILFAGTVQVVARILGAVVAIMGAAFLVCAIDLNPDLALVLKGSLSPSLPEGSGLLCLGLVGTTVVPYNLFLGSGLARGQSLAETRFGLALAIPLGGVISMAILITGTAVKGDFSFPALAECLSTQLGSWARWLFVAGLFLAGLSSAITAPLAAAITLRGYFASRSQSRWSDRSWQYRCTWGSVLLVGLGFGLTEVKPVPVILLAQALNGVLLPLVALYLWIMVNKRQTLGIKHLNKLPSNLLMGLTVLVTFLLGTTGVLKALFTSLSLDPPGERILLVTAATLALLLTPKTLRVIQKARTS